MVHSCRVIVAAALVGATTAPSACTVRSPPDPSEKGPSSRPSESASHEPTEAMTVGIVSPSLTPPASVSENPSSGAVGPEDAGAHDAGLDAAPFDASSIAGSLHFIGVPTFIGNENPRAPLVGVVRFETAEPVAAELRVAGADEEWRVVARERGTQFELPVLGLLPATAYEVTVSARSETATLVSEPLAWTTPELPADFPPISVDVSEPEGMEPGMTLFNVRRATEGLLVIADHQGRVRWYFEDPALPVTEDHRRLPNGDFLFLWQRRYLVQMNLLGDVVKTWHAARFPMPYTPREDSTAVETDSFHHEAVALDDGNFLALSTQARTVEGFPTSETDPDAPTETALVVGGAIVEFTPQGEVVREIALLDLLDPLRIGRDSLGNYWTVYGDEARDWGHENALVYDAESDAYYVSIRQQDAVVKIDRRSESVVWILGTPANWRAPWTELLLSPVDDLGWPYHQHGVELSPLGLLMYDNGNYRAGAFEPQTSASYSRAVAYEIDEVAMTVREAWSYGTDGAGAFYSGAMGDSDYLSTTGNVLITNAELGPVGAHFGQILEVTQGGTRVFRLDVGDASGSGSTSYGIYRAERVSDIRSPTELP